MSEELLEPFLRRIRISKILRHIPEGCILCDIGCGFKAKFLLDISDHISKGYGFDKKIENKNIRNIELRTADISRSIPLQDESVDCITLLAVLEHLSDPEKVLSECYRILRHDGALILTTPSPISKPLLEFLSFRLNIVSPLEIADHKHYYSKGDLVNLLSRIRLENIEVKSFELGLNNMAIAFKV